MPQQNHDAAFRGVQSTATRTSAATLIQQSSSFDSCRAPNDKASKPSQVVRISASEGSPPSSVIEASAITVVIAPARQSTTISTQPHNLQEKINQNKIPSSLKLVGLPTENVSDNTSDIASA